MSEAWDNYHRRAEAVREVVTLLDHSRSEQPPWNPALAAIFERPDDLLVALHDLWTRRLEARVHMELDMNDSYPEEPVAAAWRATTVMLPGVRRLLDAHADHPALAMSELHEHRLLAVAAGYAGVAQPLEQAADAGRLLVTRLRRAQGQIIEPTEPSR